MDVWWDEGVVEVYKGLYVILCHEWSDSFWNNRVRLWSSLLLFTHR
jgi:hypothetical protein